jgi:hypothetical protein
VRDVEGCAIMCSKAMDSYAPIWRKGVVGCVKSDIEDIRVYEPSGRRAFNAERISGWTYGSS